LPLYKQNKEHAHKRILCCPKIGSSNFGQQISSIIIVTKRKQKEDNYGMSTSAKLHYAESFSNNHNT